MPGQFCQLAICSQTQSNYNNVSGYQKTVQCFYGKTISDSMCRIVQQYNSDLVADSDQVPSVSSVHLPANESSDCSLNVPPAPHQPEVSCIPTQKLAKKVLTFQQSWYKAFPWLHYDATKRGVLCHVCLTAKSRKLSDLAKYSEDTFTSKGFSNWKKALEKFRAHEKCVAHRLSKENLCFATTSKSVDVHLNRQLEAEQKRAHKCLMKVISSLKYLAEQGLAIRGKENNDGNFLR